MIEFPLQTVLLTFSVQVYLDGVNAFNVNEIAPEDLLLRPKLLLFGGGLVAQNRGG